MTIERWEMLLSSKADRYLLKIRGDRDDVERIVQTHSRTCHEPQTINDPVFQWVIFVVDATLGERLAIQNQILSMVKQPPSERKVSNGLSDVLSELSGVLEELTGLDEEEHARVLEKMQEIQEREVRHAEALRTAKPPVSPSNVAPPATPQPPPTPPIEKKPPMPQEPASASVPPKQIEKSDPPPPAPVSQPPAPPVKAAPEEDEKSSLEVLLDTNFFNPNLDLDLSPPASSQEVSTQAEPPPAPESPKPAASEPVTPMPAEEKTLTSEAPLEISLEPDAVSSPVTSEDASMKTPETSETPKTDAVSETASPVTENSTPVEKTVEPVTPPMEPLAPPEEVSLPISTSELSNTQDTSAIVNEAPVDVTTEVSSAPPPIEEKPPEPVVDPTPAVASISQEISPEQLEEANRMMGEVDQNEKKEDLLPELVSQGSDLPEDQVLRAAFFYPEGTESSLKNFLHSLTEIAQKKAKKPIFLRPVLTQSTVVSLENATEWIWSAKSAGANCFFVILPNDVLPDVMDSAVGEARATGLHAFMVPKNEIVSRLLYVDLMVELMLLKRKK